MLKEILIKSLLILLLPCIVLALYLEGQRYDPALLDFKSAPKKSQSEQILEKTPLSDTSKAIDGFNIIGKPREFTKDNLYEHVNGHAEYFIGMGFKKLTVSEYAANGNQPEIQVEVFDMGMPLQAFGVLMDAVGSKATSVSVGSMGFKTQNAVLFIKGQYYVRVIPYKKEANIIAFAKGFERLLPSSKTDPFGVFGKLPKIGKVISTKYVKEGYRGLDFLNNVIERQYEYEGGVIHLALLVAKEEEIKTVVRSALEFLGKSGSEYQRIQTPKGEVFKIHDKYEGDWVMIHSKDAVICLFGNINDDVIKKVSDV
ncbi:MAG: hypothetical protein N3A62_07660 [Thermodesulfovibrionales bacterium]|nr:hypothetical protein [Thermodesulfovibrionales bacterium]